jgi:hypothetical protein
MPEHRQYIRYNSEGSVIIKPAQGPARSIHADLLDLSFIGISVFSRESLEEGSRVDFKLECSAWGAWLAGSGEVKYALKTKNGSVEGFKMGIDFSQVDKGIVEYAIHRIRAAEIAKKRRKERKKAALPVQLSEKVKIRPKRYKYDIR